MSKVVKNGKLYVNNKNPLEKNNESSLDKQEGFDVMTNNYISGGNTNTYSGGNTNTYSAGNGENGEISIKNRAEYKELKELQTTYERQLQAYNQAVKTLIEESKGYITASNRNNNRFANTYLRDGDPVGYVTERGVFKYLPNPQIANSMQGKNGCPVNWMGAQSVNLDAGQSSIADAPEGKMVNVQGIPLVKGSYAIPNQSCSYAGQNIYITNPAPTSNRKYVECSQNPGILQSDLGYRGIEACAKRAEDMGTNTFQFGPNIGQWNVGSCYINGGGNPLDPALCPYVPGFGGQMGVVQPGKSVQSNQGGWWNWWNWNPPTWVPGYSGFATYQTTGASTSGLGQTFHITDDLTRKTYQPSMISGYGNDFQVLSGYDSYGNDIVWASGLSVEQAKQKCLATPGAAGFYMRGDQCWIKNNNMWPNSKRQYTQDGDLYIRHVTVNNNNSCSKKVNFSDSANISGYSDVGSIDMNTTCGLGTISARDTQLIKIQYDKLNALLDKIYQKIVELSKEDAKLNERLLSGYNLLKSKLNKYENTYKEIRVSKEAVPQNDAMAEDSNLQMLSYNKKFILWSIVALGVTVGTMNAMK